MSERFAVVIPALNAERTIEAVVRACRSEIKDVVVVVDDGSIDRTASAAAAQEPSCCGTVSGAAKEGP